MSEIKTSRPYQERFLEGFDRSQLRQEVQKVKPKRFQGLRKKYATLALGATLAVGGIGTPMKMIQNAQGSAKGKAQNAATAELAGAPIDKAITEDLETAKSIAAQVAGGVAAVAQGAQKATSAPLQAVAEAPKQMAVVSESVKEQFFKSEVPFGSIIWKEAKKNNIPPELVAAVVKAESRFKPTARSHAGAQGLMQLVPKTGRWMGAKNLMNPVENIAAGAKYLRYLNDRFDGNQTKVIAAYNAGEGNVQRFGGIPPFKETRNYVKKVRNYQADFKNLAENRVADVGTTLAR